MEGNSIIGMAGGFIALSIMLGIGTLILGGSVTDCSQLEGYDTSDASDSTGWALQCITNNEQSQSGYGLLMVSLIVLAAAVVLIVVRMLST